MQTLEQADHVLSSPYVETEVRAKMLDFSGWKGVDIGLAHMQGGFLRGFKKPLTGYNKRI